MILPFRFVSFDICMNEFLTIGISPFLIQGRSQLSCHREWMHRHPKDVTHPCYELIAVSGMIARHTKTSACSRAQLDAIAKYTEYKSSICAMGVFRSHTARPCYFHKPYKNFFLCIPLRSLSFQLVALRLHFALVMQAFMPALYLAALNGCPFHLFHSHWAIFLFSS